MREQYEVPDIEGCTPKCLKEPALSFRELEGIGPNHPRPECAGFDPRPAGVVPGLKSGQAAGLYRRYGRAVDGLESATAMSARRVLIRRCRGRVL